MKRRLIYICITIVFMLLLYLPTNSKVYASLDNVSLPDKYYKNVANSVNDYQLIYPIVSKHSSVLSQDEEKVYVDNYAGAFIDDNYILNINLLKQLI